MKIIIAGSRGFKDYQSLKTQCDVIIADYRSAIPYSARSSIKIISGGARGADSLGEKYAHEKGFECLVMPADWDKYGKRAGYLRNAQMAEVADALIAFWDGTSRGTWSMIELARKGGLKVTIVSYNDA